MHAGSNDVNHSKRKHIVIVGAGFGGLTAAKKLANSAVDVTLIDRENHHLFQPLLYQVATASLSPAEIAWPIRRLVRNHKNIRVLLGEVENIDQKRKCVLLGDKEVAYDRLIIATGAKHSYFGNDQWAFYSHGLKSLEDATEIRKRLLLAFEKAEMESNPETRRRHLSIIIVGGGPTGVEMAGAISELAHKALSTDFRNIDPKQTNVILVEAGSRLLSGFPEHLSRYAEQALRRLGVDVRLENTVTGLDSEGVVLDNTHIAAETVIWAAGVAASPAAQWLGVEPDNAGRVPVGSDLKPAGMRDIFVIGDTALALDDDGFPLPGIAPVAKQQGSYVAKAIKMELAGRQDIPCFRYRDRGLLATIGRKEAVIAFRNLTLKGGLAWWLWGAAHIYFLIGIRNRLLVAIQWLWSYITFEHGTRLITGNKSRTQTEKSREYPHNAASGGENTSN